MQKQRGKRAARRFMLRYFIFALIMFICMYGVSFVLTVANDQGSSSSPKATLTSVSSPGSAATGTLRVVMSATPTPDPPPISVETTATEYYQAIEAQSYVYAYSFLDPNATGLSQAAFLKMAQAADKAEGKVQSFSVTAFPPEVVMTVSRSMGPYHVHLLFQQENNAWKIVSLDRI
jgi:hypothetical protein